jgi:hypothetical protein
MSTENQPANQYEGKALSDGAQLGSPTPVWVLSADDPLAPALIRHWVELSKFNKDVTPGVRELARKRALAMELWQKDHGMAP